jgi:hypothetical protein
MKYVVLIAGLGVAFRMMIYAAQLLNSATAALSLVHH